MRGEPFRCDSLQTSGASKQSPFRADSSAPVRHHRLVTPATCPSDRPPLPRTQRLIVLASYVALLASCGGGGGDAPAPPPPPPIGNGVIATAASPIDAACNGGSTTGTLYVNAEVEPIVAANPLDPNHLVGAWQQDRWSDGGARAVMSAVSFDGGRTWARQLLPFSRCAGGTGLTGDYARATDPWLDIGPDGTVHAMGLAFSGGAFTPGSMSAMLAVRSTDGGRTWSTPAVLVRDGDTLFNDKNSLTADSTDARYVYAVWDRLDAQGNGPTLMARSSNGGVSWETARAIYTPTSLGVSQTIGNRIVVRGGVAAGTLVNLFTQLDTVAGQTSAWLGVVRSADKGATWSAPIRVAELRAVGARDPQTGKAIRDGAQIPSIAAAPDGSFWVAWQDARFSGGVRDAIAITRSTDGGLTWSTPLAINRVPGSAAFTPTLAMRADGLVGVMHYDLRNDTASASSLLVNAWLLASRDGATWSEVPVFGTFDLAQAPDANGLFLGDYQGLASAGTTFLPLLGIANLDTANRTDIVASRIEPATVAAAQAGRARALSAMASPSEADDARWRAATHEALVRAMEQRVPGWAARVGARPPP